MTSMVAWPTNILKYFSPSLKYFSFRVSQPYHFFSIFFLSPFSLSFSFLLVLTYAIFLETWFSYLDPTWCWRQTSFTIALNSYNRDTDNGTSAGEYNQSNAGEIPQQNGCEERKRGHQARLQELSILEKFRNNVRMYLVEFIDRLASFQSPSRFILLIASVKRIPKLSYYFCLKNCVSLDREFYNSVVDCLI